VSRANLARRLARETICPNHRHLLDPDHRAGPIVIAGLRVRYSGVQACKALRAEGYRIVLVNSNRPRS